MMDEELSETLGEEMMDEELSETLGDSDMHLYLVTHDYKGVGELTHVERSTLEPDEFFEDRSKASRLERQLIRVVKVAPAVNSLMSVIAATIAKWGHLRELEQHLGTMLDETEIFDNLANGFDEIPTLLDHDKLCEMLNTLLKKQGLEPIDYKKNIKEAHSG